MAAAACTASVGVSARIQPPRIHPPMRLASCAMRCRSEATSSPGKASRSAGPSRMRVASSFSQSPVARDSSWAALPGPAAPSSPRAGPRAPSALATVVFESPASIRPRMNRARRAAAGHGASASLQLGRKDSWGHPGPRPALQTSRSAGRPATAWRRSDLVPPRGIGGVNDDGLQDAVLSDVIREFIELGFRDLGARVVAVLTLPWAGLRSLGDGMPMESACSNCSTPMTARGSSWRLLGSQDSGPEQLPVLYFVVDRNETRGARPRVCLYVGGVDGTRTRDPRRDRPVF